MAYKARLAKPVEKSTGYKRRLDDNGKRINTDAPTFKPGVDVFFGPQNKSQGVYAELNKRPDTRMSQMPDKILQLSLGPVGGKANSTPQKIDKTPVVDAAKDMLYRAIRKKREGKELRGEITPEALAKLQKETADKARKSAVEYLTKNPKGRMEAAQGVTVEDVLKYDKEIAAGGALMAIARPIADAVNPEKKALVMTSKLASEASLLKKGLIPTSLIDKADNALSVKPVGERKGSINRLIEEIKKGKAEPIKVRQLESGSLVIEDGRHRIEAYKRLDEKNIPYQDVTGEYNKGKKIGDFGDVFSLRAPATKQGKSMPELVARHDRLVPEAKMADKLTDTKAAMRKKLNDEVPGFEVPEETMLQKFQRKIQDKMNRLGVTQEAIIRSGKEISEEADALLKERLFIGAASDKINKFQDNLVIPMAKNLKEKGVGIDEFGEYLMARHAPERNAKILEEYGREAGSGIDDDMAREIVSNFESKHGPDIAKEAETFYKNITDATLKMKLDNGIINRETYDILKTAYKNYVPLKGKPGKTATIKPGQGYDIKSTGIKRAYGRDTLADNPFMQAVLDYESTIVQVEKNKVLTAMANLIEQNPNPDLWKIESVSYLPKFDKFGEIVGLDPRFKPSNNVVQFYQDGKPKLMTINDDTLARAMKNLGSERSFGFLNQINNYLRAINTTLSPEFMLTNFARDIQTASINIGTEQSAKLAAKIAKDAPKAVINIWKELRKGGDNEWINAYKELKELGGKTGYFDFNSLAEREMALKKAVETQTGSGAINGAKKVLEATGNLISDMNEAVEMGVRLSAFKHAKEAGISPAKAADLAKNLTVDFNRKGEWGSAINSLYLFFNAGVQGSARILFAAKKNPKKFAKIIIPIIGSSFALAELNRNINEEAWDDIPETIKNKNLIMMTPSGSYYKIALPYGYNIFKIMGDMASDSVHGTKKVGEMGKRMLVALDDSFNPLSSGSIGQMISPTVGDPFVQQGENKNWAGVKIKPDQLPFGAEKKDSSLYWSSVRPQTKAVTDWLNKVTGGNEVEAGYIDISPELVDHWFDFFTGSAGAFTGKLGASALDLSKGQLPAIENAPFASKFIGTPSEYANRQTIDDIKKDSGTRELDDMDNKRLKQSIREELELGKITVKDAAKTIKAIQKSQDRIKASRIYEEVKSMTAEEKKELKNTLTPSIIKELAKIIREQASEK